MQRRCCGRRDGAFPFIERIIGDAGYQGRKMEAAVARTGTWELQIVRRCDRHRFVVLPKRWIVERTLAWISRAGGWPGTTSATPAKPPLSSASP